MKKLMMALAIAGLALSTAACSDEEKAECPKNPIVFQMISDLETVAALPTSSIVECGTFAESIATVSDNYAEQYDAAKVEAESIKDTDAKCKAKLIALGLLKGFSVADLYTSLSDKGEACKTLLVGDENKANLDKMNGALTTTAGWKDILQSAANAL